MVLRIDAQFLLFYVGDWVWFRIERGRANYCVILYCCSSKFACAPVVKAYYYSTSMHSTIHSASSTNEVAMHRMRIISGHLIGASRTWNQVAAGGSESQLTPSVKLSVTAAEARPVPCFIDRDDDIVIVSALRTAICKSSKGGFKVRGVKLLSCVRIWAVENCGSHDLLHRTAKILHRTASA